MGKLISKTVNIQRNYSVVMNRGTVWRYFTGGEDAKVDNSNPSTSVIRITSENGHFYHTFLSCDPLPRNAVTCWAVHISSGHNPRVVLGVNSNLMAFPDVYNGDGTEISWSGCSGIKSTYGGGGILEPGLGRFCTGDVLHLKYNPFTYRLDLRLDRKPNRHFSASLDIAPEYYACIGIHGSGVLKVQTEAPW